MGILEFSAFHVQIDNAVGDERPGHETGGLDVGVDLFAGLEGAVAKAEL